MKYLKTPGSAGHGGRAGRGDCCPQEPTPLPDCRDLLPQLKQADAAARPALPFERTLQAAAAHAVTVTKQDEQRDRVVVTGPWAEGWYISGVWFDVPNNRKLPPNPLTAPSAT